MRIRYQAADQSLHLWQILHPVADKKSLTSARHLIADGIADDFFVEAAQFGLYGLAVGWGGAYYA